MRYRTIGLLAVLFVSLWITACGGGSTKAPAGEAAAPAKAGETAAAPAPERGSKGFQKIGDYLDAWTALYNQNEAVINGYEAMPIMELVDPADDVHRRRPIRPHQPHGEERTVRGHDDAFGHQGLRGKIRFQDHLRL